MNNSLLRISFAAIIGIVLVVWPDMVPDYIVRTIGLLFIIAGIFSIMGYSLARRKCKKIIADPDIEEKPSMPRFPIEGIGSILLGIWLNISPSTVISILMYVLGFIILMGGVWQLASLLNARRWTKVHFAFYIFPTLILLAGLFIVADPSGALDTMFMAIGYTFLIYAIFEAISWFKFTRRKPTPSTTDIDKSDVEDVTPIS